MIKNLILSAIILLASLNFKLFGQEKVSKKQSEPIVLIKTDLGDIKVKLYNETPIHRDNFLKLASSGKYDGSIFHRVIPQFMIQGGGLNGGTQDIGEPLKAEILPQFIHKRGALAAARMGDHVNPERKSSGSQFYIVQGRKFTEQDLKLMSQRTGFVYSQEQIDEYIKNGGAPHLDGAYTVFGEVIEGMDVVDKIASVERNAADRPLQDIKMTMKVLKK
jgi:cyclophilin family peptidyl-prolyl cis-trans isomerase